MTGLLDPNNWDDFSEQAHKQLDVALSTLQNASEGRVWTAVPDAMKAELKSDLPVSSTGSAAVRTALESLIPYRTGNTHPRFFGWVHGTGAPSALLAEITAVAMNANCGGRDHIGPYVEKQVLDWTREIMGFPEGTSGLIVSGTSMATVIAMKSARDKRLGDSRKSGVSGRLVGYVAKGGHSCLAQAFDILGIGTDALRVIPVDENFQMDMDVLASQHARDLADGFEPFCIIGTAGSVNLGAIDRLDEIADFAHDANLWFHIDGAFGATAILADSIAPRLKGLERADSLAFDFHKWLHVTYDAGCVLIRDGQAHKAAFSDRPDYLRSAERGLAAGDFWAVDYGPELSRGFRALKVWAHLLEHGTKKLGAAIEQNVSQAAYLGGLVTAHPDLELLAPVLMNVVVFRFGESDELNNQIVVDLQESGIAVPSTTLVNGKLAIRVNITNHRTRNSDLDLLVSEIVKLGHAAM
jgi:glutamate/tyrosine decarboxylase-like PLP-dependent enzyme